MLHIFTDPAQSNIHPTFIADSSPNKGRDRSEHLRNVVKDWQPFVCIAPTLGTCLQVWHSQRLERSNTCSGNSCTPVLYHDGKYVKHTSAVRRVGITLFDIYAYAEYMHDIIVKVYMNHAHLCFYVAFVDITDSTSEFGWTSFCIRLISCDIFSLQKKYRERERESRFKSSIKIIKSLRGLHQEVHTQNGSHQRIPGEHHQAGTSHPFDRKLLMDNKLWLVMTENEH